MLTVKEISFFSHFSYESAILRALTNIELATQPPSLKQTGAGKICIESAEVKQFIAKFKA